MSLKKDKKPIKVEIKEDELQELVKKITETTYFDYVKPLTKFIKGKTVNNSYAGISGFILVFSDSSFLICYLKDDFLKWQYSEKQLESIDLEKIKNNDYHDVSSPLKINYPYSDEDCDIEKELKNSYGKTITGVAIGEISFNLCFPNGKELETMIVENGLRVFWEQW